MSPLTNSLAQQFVVSLGDPAGANAGRVSLNGFGTSGVTGIDAWVTGWWR